MIDRKSRLGGVSVYTGTIPSKTLRETVLNLIRVTLIGVDNATYHIGENGVDFHVEVRTIAYAAYGGDRSKLQFQPKM